VVSALLAVAPEGSLILLDELATATDPEEGSALAQALVEALSARNMLTVVTTHYTALKTWAADERGAGRRVSAGMGYDLETMTPTYRLSLGRPGASLGLDVAARLGVSNAILDRARSLVSPQAAALAGALAALDRERHALTELKTRLGALEAAARDAALRQDAAAAALEHEREAFADAKRTRLAEEVRRARAELDAILDAARRESEPRRIRGLKPRLDAVSAAVESSAARPEAGPAGDYEAGARVRVVSFGTEGVLLNGTRGRKRVRVRVGDREISVSTAELRPGRAAASGLETAPDSGGTGPPEDAPETVNVIGARVEEALARVDRALDHAAAAGALRLRVLHGHGTGRLKAAIRTHLAASPYVASHRPGDDVEGGDAVTMVALR
jgi:DNA mismatch repair protein MutS2